MGLFATVFLSGLGVVVMIWIGLFIMNKASYRYKCQVAIPVGESADDVIYVDDSFKTKNIKGSVHVQFRKNRGKVYSPGYKFWGKWLKGKKHLPGGIDDKAGWAKINDPDLRKHLIRGAHFYKVNDNEYKVMKISTDGNFNVIDHDSIELVLDDIERQNEITTSFRDKLLQLGLWLGSLFIISLLAIMIIVLTMKFAGEQSAQIAAQAATVAKQAAQTAVGG